MNTHTRRKIFAIAGATALAGKRAFARPFFTPSSPLLSCGAPAVGTPVIVAVESEIAFEEAYIDTTVPYHGNALLLTELALDDLEDDRLLEIAGKILETHPQDLEYLGDVREELFGERETAEATPEKMLIAMGGLESCTDETHLNFLDPEWVEDSFTDHDDPELAYTSMLVLVMDMEIHQHHSAVVLAEHDGIRGFAERMVEEMEPVSRTLKDIRGELLNRY